ncbi:sugar ABC transporter permease [Deinococcus deserti]|uniref:Putative sugar ABC transporter, permease component, putative sn-glycerol-3-phosphate transport system permease protein ugpA n=1 Tax=Deinococcus deserti (strain DSM 17065 / CIP 109153 / LMG 22923 / VCD115) TaxID=546414 RepID=C1D3R6_DEIDV|nr:sugar ABC transporter permease [Deinococcus deserti]ACO48145.1 putative sugar ABC transporter, permease component, putative sn-glycerol-3-phosphate transport system permease protein ugpA [Deinococcus deserti VCD115]
MTDRSLPRVRTRRPFPWHVVVFLAPALLIYTLVMIYPILSSLWLSLNNRSPDGSAVFVGLSNYQKLLGSELYAQPMWNALKNNFVFFAVHMLVQNPVGLLLAVLLSFRLRGSAVYRTLLFTPTILSVVIIGFAWKLILNPAWGVQRALLTPLNLQEFDLPWLGLPATALPTLSLISVWQNIGIPMLLFLAALVRIPEELYEAARLDGAGAWTIFRRIQLPLILPTVGIVSVLTFVGNFNAFDLIYSTQGALAGPNFASDILGTLFYRTFFGYQLQSGDPYMGAAVAGVMLVVILAGLLIYLTAWQRRITEVQL